jgi:AcrR family transcriptional regulator
MVDKPPTKRNKASEGDIYAFRHPIQARGKEKFNQILDATDKLIVERGVDDVSLYDIAEHAGVAVGSVYHFFPSMQSTLVALVERYDQNFANIVTKPVNPKLISGWVDVLYHQTERSRQYINKTPAAMILILGPGQNWGTRLADADGDNTIAEAMIDCISSFFHLPNNPPPNEIMLNSIKILESLWTLSYIRHGTVTDTIAEETRRAMTAYLSLYWPKYMDPVSR